MTNQIKSIAPIIWEEIQKANSILLHCHPNPDPDSLGSALAFGHFLSQINKNSTVIIGDSSLPSTMSHLPGFSGIQPINFTQVKITDFDLFIILDSSSPGQITKKAAVNFPSNLRTIIIDHHATNTRFADINLVETSYPAVGQILFDLFNIWGVHITKEIATCLFMAIYSDTGGFKYPLTTKDTLSAAAKLASINPNFTQDIFWYENSYDPQHILYLGLALSNIKSYFSDKVAMSTIDYQQLIDNGIKPTHTEKMEIANTLKSVKGWEMGICLTEKSPNEVSISFRTRDPNKYDVAKIASATGYGGGHPGASGATLMMSINEATDLILKTIQKVYPELGEP